MQIAYKLQRPKLQNHSNMMKKNTIVGLLSAAILSACSTTPKVVADVSTTLPARPADSIAVYEQGTLVPQNAVEIGRVKVTGGELTPAYDCTYNNMLALAVKRTAQAGGNGLRIDEHKAPNFWSPHCHSVKGTMLLLPNGTAIEETAKTLQAIEQRRDAERQEVAMTMLERAKQIRNTPKNIVKTNFGFSDMYSEFDVGDRTYKSKMGFDYALAYQHLWQLIGFELSYEAASFRFNNNIKNSVTCIGPSLVLSLMFGKHWRYEFLVGINYAHYREEYKNLKYTEDGAAFRLGTGLDFMFNQHLGLGIDIDFHSFKLDEPEGVNLPDNEFYGIKRANLTGGLRYYF